MRILLYRNCQVLSVFSLEPSLERTSSLPCLRPGSFEEPAMFASVKKNKCIRSSTIGHYFRVSSYSLCEVQRLISENGDLST